MKMWSEKFAQLEHGAVPGPRYPLPHRDGRRAQAQGDLYIHAEAYAAGELKHGPLALVDKNMPVIAIAPKDALLEKLKSNLQEVRARGGELHVLADQDTRMVATEGVHVIRMPITRGSSRPSCIRSRCSCSRTTRLSSAATTVDKPRNLAKSVTVE